MSDKIIKKIIIYTSILCIIYSIIAFLFNFIPFFDKDLLLKLFDKYKVYENIPFVISMDDIKNAVYELMNYLKGKSAFLNTTAYIDGVNTELYTVTSKIHMADCRNIFLAHKSLGKALFLIGIFGIIYSLKVNDKPFTKIYKAYKNILIFLSIIIISIMLYAISNFDSFFIKMHELLFTNDYWYFDPCKDYIINFLPEEIFMHIGFMILTSIVFSLALLFSLTFLLHRSQSHQEAK